MTGRRPKKDKQDDPARRMAYYQERIQKFGKKYKHFNWPAVEVFFNLVSTYDVLTAKTAQLAHRHGLSRAAVNVLSILSRSETKGCKHRDISQLLLVSRANVTGLIESLIRRGLVKREYDSTDRRVCIAKITKEGERLLETILPENYKLVNTLFSCLDPEEKKTLTRLLTKLRDRLPK